MTQQELADSYRTYAAVRGDAKGVRWVEWVEMSEVSRDGFMQLARADAFDRMGAPPPVVFVASDTAGTW